MTEAAVIEKPEVVVDPPFTRRFERPDIDKHAVWFIPRLLKNYPHLTERSVYTWLLNILDSNEFMFLYQDHAIALAQVVAYSMRPDALVEEIFVWCENPEDKVQQVDAAYFYDHFYLWAKRKGLPTLIVEESSDVPHDAVRERLNKRLFERKQIFAKVS